MHVVFLGQYEFRHVLDQVDRREYDSDYKATRFPLNAPSTGWRRRSRYRAFLIANDAENAEGLSFIGVASVSVRGVYHSEERAELEVGPCLLFAETLPVTKVLQRLKPQHVHHFRRVLAEEGSRELPAATGRDATEAVLALVPDLAEIMRQLPEPHTPEARRFVGSSLPLLNAGQSALRVFSRRWYEIEPEISAAPPSEIATGLEYSVRVSENDAITDDASSFLDWTLTGSTVGGWFEFRESGRQLLVKNVNVSHSETVTGADLVYVTLDPVSVVLVQYKLLEEMKTHDHLVFRPDSRLPGQLKRMASFGQPIQSFNQSSDVRLNNAVGFVTFVDPSPRRSVDARAIRFGGHYHPVDLVARMLQEPSVGPRGGAVHKVSDWRSIDAETFARLVRDRWVGSQGAGTETLIEVLGLEFRGEPIVIAVEAAVPGEPSRTR